MFDTGAFKTVMTLQAAQRLGLRRDRGITLTAIKGIGGERQTATYRAHTLSIGTLHGDDWHFMVADIGLSGFNPPVDGSLGADILWPYDVDIDIPGGKIVFYMPQHDCTKPSTFLHQPLYSVALEKPFQYKPDAKSPKWIKAFFALSPPTEASPRIKVSIGGKDLIAEIDTGSPSSVVFLNGAMKLGLTSDQLAQDPGFFAHGIGPSFVPARRHVVAPIEIGDLEISNFPVDVIAQRNDSGLDMILGLDLLKRIHVWVSHSSSTLIMQFPPAPSPVLPLPPVAPAPS